MNTGVYFLSAFFPPLLFEFSHNLPATPPPLPHLLQCRKRIGVLSHIGEIAVLQYKLRNKYYKDLLIKLRIKTMANPVHTQILDIHKCCIQIKTLLH